MVTQIAAMEIIGTEITQHETGAAQHPECSADVADALIELHPLSGTWRSKIEHVRCRAREGAARDGAGSIAAPASRTTIATRYSRARLISGGQNRGRMR